MAPGFAPVGVAPAQAGGLAVAAVGVGSAGTGPAGLGGAAEAVGSAGAGVAGRGGAPSSADSPSSPPPSAVASPSLIALRPSVAPALRAAVATPLTRDFTAVPLALRCSVPSEANDILPSAVF